MKYVIGLMVILIVLGIMFSNDGVAQEPTCRPTPTVVFKPRVWLPIVER